MLLGWYCCDIYWKDNSVHNCGKQTICLLCPWPEQALMRSCDTCAACNFFWGHPDNDPAKSKHAALGMICKTVVFDRYVIVYSFILLFPVQAHNWVHNFQTGCICLSAVCFWADFHRSVVFVTRIVGLCVEHVDNCVTWMICQSAIGLCHFYQLLHYVTGRQPSRHDAMPYR